MFHLKVLLLTLLLVAGADVPAEDAPTVAVSPASPSNTSSPSLPPPRVADCVGFALLDDKCTAEWYSCKRGAADTGACIDRWQSCCTLPGQGARSRLGSAQPVTSSRR